MKDLNTKKGKRIQICDKAIHGLILKPKYLLVFGDREKKQIREKRREGKEEEEEKRRRKKEGDKKSRYGTCMNLYGIVCMDFCMDMYRDTCLEVCNTSLCVEYLFRMVVWFGCGPQ